MALWVERTHVAGSGTADQARATSATVSANDATPRDALAPRHAEARAGAFVRVRVLGAESGDELTVYCTKSGAWVWGRSMARGAELLAPVPPGELTLRLNESQHVAGLEQRVTAHPGETVDLTFDLTSAPVLEFEMVGIPPEVVHASSSMFQVSSADPEHMASMAPFFSAGADANGIIRIAAARGRVLSLRFGDNFGSVYDLVDAQTGASHFEVVASRRFVVHLEPSVGLVGVHGTSWLAGYAPGTGVIMPIVGWLFVDKTALGDDALVVGTLSGWGSIAARDLVCDAPNWAVIDRDWLRLTVQVEGITASTPPELLLTGPERRDTPLSYSSQSDDPRLRFEKTAAEVEFSRVVPGEYSLRWVIDRAAMPSPVIARIRIGSERDQRATIRAEDAVQHEVSVRGMEEITEFLLCDFLFVFGSLWRAQAHESACVRVPFWGGRPPSAVPQDSRFLTGSLPVTVTSVGKTWELRPSRDAALVTVHVEPLLHGRLRARPDTAWAFGAVYPDPQGGFRCVGQQGQRSTLEMWERTDDSREHFRGFIDVLPSQREVRIDATLEGHWVTVDAQSPGRFWDLCMSDGTKTATLPPVFTSRPRDLWVPSAIRTVSFMARGATKTIPIDPGTTLVDLDRD